MVRILFECSKIMAKVLLLGAGTQSLAIIPSLHRLGHRIVIITELHPNYGDKSKFVDKVYRIETSDGNERLAFVSQVVKQEGIDVIIPMGDADAEFLSKNKSNFAGQRFVIPDYATFLKGYDKNQLLTLCQEKGYPHPQTADLSKVDYMSGELKSFPFPAMLKPNCTTGGRGMVEVKSYEEFANVYPDLHTEYGEYHLQCFIKAGGRQVKVQLYVDEKQHLVAHSVQHKMRWYPNNAGSNCCARSITDEHIVGICYNILRDIKWEGFADFDTIEDPDTGELLIMEINPRLPACIKGSIVAGVDWGEILMHGALGLPQKRYQYREGVVLRHLGLDILWFLHAENRWHAKPNWFKFLGGKIYYQDMNGWFDPMPFLTGTWNNVKKLFDPKFKKAKKGV